MPQFLTIYLSAEQPGSPLKQEIQKKDRSHHAFYVEGIIGYHFWRLLPQDFIWIMIQTKFKTHTHT